MKPNRRLAVAGIVTGSLLTLAPVFGIVGTMFAMIGAFNTLGSAGVADPRALASHVGEALFSTAAGLILCPIGIVMLTISILFYVRRRELEPPPLP